MACCEVFTSPSPDPRPHSRAGANRSHGAVTAMNCTCVHEWSYKRTRANTEWGRKTLSQYTTESGECSLVQLRRRLSTVVQVGTLPLGANDRQERNLRVGSGHSTQIPHSHRRNICKQMSCTPSREYPRSSPKLESERAVRERGGAKEGTPPPTHHFQRSRQFVTRSP